MALLQSSFSCRLHRKLVCLSTGSLECNKIAKQEWTALPQLSVNIYAFSENTPVEICLDIYSPEFQSTDSTRYRATWREMILASAQTTAKPAAKFEVVKRSITSSYKTGKLHSRRRLSTNYEEKQMAQGHTTGLSRCT